MILLTVLMAISCLSLSAALIVNENIQSWDAHTSYGSWTQTIPAGQISMTSCLVSPGAAANGEGSAGRIQLQATTGALQFPELSSIGAVEFTISAGSTGRSVRLQRFDGSVWVDLVTFSGISATGSRFFYNWGQSSPGIIRLANPSHAIYIHDIFITDYMADPLPQISTPLALELSYSGAELSAFIESSGSSAISSRGFCWDTSADPDTSDAHSLSGFGISPMFYSLRGLQAETVYYVRAYAINASGVAYSFPISFLTPLISTPTLQTTELIFYPGNTSIQASWTPGNGSRRLVLINTENNFNTPTNGVEYIPNSVYNGTGQQVVYCGSTQMIEGEEINAIPVTGLIRNTTYWFRAFEINGTGANTTYLGSAAIGNPAAATTLNTGLAGYYNNIEGYGTELKEDLHNLLRESHLTQFSYSALWQQLQYTDEDSLNTNNIIQTYTGWSIPKNFYGSGVTQWNREHTWSTSHGGFDTNRPAGTDLHHIRPCDVTVNSSKGNKDFDNGGNSYVDASPYPGNNATTGCFADPDSWEPRPVEKGDVARMLFYMATRYEGTDTGYNLEMQDLTPTQGSYYGKLSTLLQWHLEDPPDAWENRRNDRIQERQGNRNPFIDHPEYVTKLWVPHVTHSIVLMEDYLYVFWTHALNAVSYSLDVSTDSLFSTFLVQDYDAGYADSHTFNITETDTVYFRLRPFYGSGYGPYSNTLRIEIIVEPVEISSFEVSLSEQQTALVEWTAVNEFNAMGYYIYRSEDSELNTANVVSPLIYATNQSEPHDYSFTDADLPGAEFSGYLYYWLACIYMDGMTYYWGPDSIYIEPSAVTDESHSPTALLSALYPNPFTNELTITYALKEASPVEISIYNLKGQRIKSYRNTAKAGEQSYIWDGKDDSGASTAAGIYLLRLSTPHRQQSAKLLKL